MQVFVTVYCMNFIIFSLSFMPLLAPSPGDATDRVDSVSVVESDLFDTARSSHGTTVVLLVLLHYLTARLITECIAVPPCWQWQCAP